MKYNNFFVVPETKLDEAYIEEEMSFLIDTSIRNRSVIKDPKTYAETIKQHYERWMTRDISFG